MMLPSLPSDRLYKVAAFGGLTLIVASFAITDRITDSYIARFEALREEIVLLRADVTTLREEVEDWNNSSPRDSATPQRFIDQRREAVRRLALAEERMRATAAAREMVDRKILLVSLLGTAGIVLALNGFTAWRRAERDATSGSVTSRQDAREAKRRSN